MEEHQKAKPATRPAKAAKKTKSDAKLTGVSIKRAPKVTAKAREKEKAVAVPMSVEQRRQLIAEAAYFRALSRGFQGGDPVADWLDAEREVDQTIADKAD